MYTKYAATPMRMKSMVQTTGKSHPGGAKGGLYNVAYCSRESAVKREASAPVPRLKNKLINRGFSFMF